MRRSLAPSQKSLAGPSNHGKIKPEARRESHGRGGNGADITISRMPLFGFLHIPDTLNKQFKIPSGSVITDETLELRKRKSLGGSRSKFQLVLPGQFRNQNFKRTSLSSEVETGDDGDAEDLPTKTSLPPFEPLVLWTSEDETRKVEVVDILASKLRPHQREGVQFLFECTMGLRGFDGQVRYTSYKQWFFRCAVVDYILYLNVCLPLFTGLYTRR